ncbi:YfzA family protein [Oceanobacillus timonensis]|uniref:YfzA family protein n=1 Tax=Oceanobacillus timonensis TaxID=1926285 RepID=UPI0015C478B8|nr:YfzA family protein [Oceanobacillus timonensis]
MMNKQQKRHLNRLRWWVTALSMFFIGLLIFHVIDGTSLEPNLNTADNLGGKAAGWLQGSQLFTEWITPFHFPWFNMVTTLFFIILVAKMMTDIISSVLSKKRIG